MVVVGGLKGIEKNIYVYFKKQWEFGGGGFIAGG